MNKDNKDIDRDYWTPYPVRLLSLEGACKYLSCSGDLLEELIALGCFPVIRLGPGPGHGKRDRRKRWLDRYDLDDFVDRKKDRLASTLSTTEGVNRG